MPITISEFAHEKKIENITLATREVLSAIMKFLEENKDKAYKGLEIAEAIKLPEILGQSKRTTAKPDNYRIFVFLQILKFQDKVVHRGNYYSFAEYNG